MGSTEVREYLNPKGLSATPYYTNVVKVGRFVFITAQLSVDEKGEFVAKGDPAGQDRQIWHNLEIAMRAAGGSLQDIVQTTTFITKPEYRRAVAETRRLLFPTNPPTTSRPIVVSEVTGSPEALVSISVIAIIPAR